MKFYLPDSTADYISIVIIITKIWVTHHILVLRSQLSTVGVDVCDWLHYIDTYKETRTVIF